MTPDRRIGVIRDGFRAFTDGDVEGIVRFLHPEVTCVVHPPLMNVGSWRGLEGFAQMAAGWEEAFGEIAYEIRAIDLPDERNALIAVHQEATGAGSGVPVALDVVFLFGFEEDRVSRFEVHSDRDSAVAAMRRDASAGA